MKTMKKTLAMLTAICTMASASCTLMTSAVESIEMPYTIGYDEDESGILVDIFDTDEIYDEFEEEKKVYFDHSLEENFSESQILITLKHACSVLNKDWTPEELDFDNIENIEDMTHMEFSEEDEKKYLGSVKFHQILKITLKEKGKEQVLSAISAFENNEMILIASPIYKSTDSEPVTEPCLLELKGDSNGDGEVNIVDVVLLAQVSLKTKSLPKSAFEYCDINGNGMIDAGDATLVLQYLSGIVTTL